MKRSALSALVSLSVVLILGAVQPATAQFYAQHNLVSDGAVPAPLTDSNMGMQREALDQLRAIAEPHGLRVKGDAEGFGIIPARYGIQRGHGGRTIE
jgi:hypothetical protein